MTLTLATAFAGECKKDGECTDDAACKAISKDYSVVGGKCINPAAKETDTQCAGIVNTSGAKASEGSGDAADKTGNGKIK